MVVEPSETVFNDMVNKIKTIASYTRGDQGFLNSYFPGFPNAHVFDPNLSPEVLKSRPVPEMVVWIASIFMPQEAVGFLQFRASRSLGFLPYLVNAVLSCLECCLCCRF